MDELLEYDEPSPSKPPPAQTAKKAADSSNDVSVLEAIAQVQQQQKVEQSVESIFGALLAQNYVNQYNENLARLRIQQYLQEQKKKKEQEAKRQEQLRGQMLLRQLQAQKAKEDTE